MNNLVGNGVRKAAKSKPERAVCTNKQDASAWFVSVSMFASVYQESRRLYGSGSSITMLIPSDVVPEYQGMIVAEKGDRQEPEGCKGYLAVEPIIWLLMTGYACVMLLI